MPTNLSPDQMKRFVRDHFEEFVNKCNAAVIRRNMTPGFVDHDGPGGKPTGVDGDEKMMLGMYKAMPDVRVTIEDMIAEGDKVACRNVWRWTDPASGKKMEFQGFVLWRFEGDRIAERWATVTAPAEGTGWTERMVEVESTGLIDAPVERIWALLDDFNSIASWHPDVTESRLESGSGREPGTVRSLQLRNGMMVRERLISISAADRRYT